MKTIFIYTFLLIGFVCFSQTTIQSELTIVNNTEVSVLNNLYIANGATVTNNGMLSIKGNFTNNGIFTYTAINNSSKINFTGVNQIISGTSTSIFYNILFNNSATTLMGAIQIDNDADFTSGIVTNRNYGGSIVFNELSDHINTSNASFVNGKVTKKGNLAFSFPIGSENVYRGFSFENLSSSNQITADYKSENSNTNYPHTSKDDIINIIDINEYWEISQVTGNEFAIIQLTRDTATSSSEINAAPLSEIHIVRWDAINNYWKDEGGILGDTPNSIKTIASVSGYGVFALATVHTYEILSDDIIVYNNLTPNGDGINDFLFISGIEKYPKNDVQLFNRWGVLVYKIKGYNNNDKVFKGIANVGLSFGSGILPSGTYYYILRYSVGGKSVKKMDYLYINGK